jgi:hypothetical protein
MILGIKTCEVGLFRLPGIVFEKGQISAEKLKEMDEWAASDHGVGKRMTDVLWSFKSEAQRDWFILKWCDEAQE